MPPQLDLLVALLELAAFFLVTPEVLGRRRLEAAYRGMGRVTAWLRGVWFSPDFGPIPPASLAVPLVLGGFVVAGLLGYDQPGTQFVVGWIVVPLTVFPAAFVVLYLTLQALQRRERLGYAMAVFGACLFVLGRAIVIVSAYHRLPG